MSEAAVSAVHLPRLNPFVFPSDTALRFVLLVIFVVCGSMRLYGDLYVNGRTDQALHDCISTLWSEIDRTRASLGTLEVTPLISRDYKSCMGSTWPQIRLGAVGVCLTIVAAALFFWLYPAWKLKTGGFERISSAELPEIAHELKGICSTARLSRAPIFVWNPITAGLPVTFGRGNRFYVALTGSFIAQHYYTDKEAFRAIILHELAHIRNGDVNKTYFVISLWIAFICIATTPAFLMSLWFLQSAHWFDAVRIAIDTMLWAGVVILSGMAVLRARECCADVRASVWHGPSHIDRALAALPEIVGKRCGQYFRLHPGSRERRQIVEDPSRLFRLSYMDAFGIGLAAWSAIDVISSVAPAFVGDPLLGYLNLVVVPAIVLLFAVGAIGIGVWRGSFASSLKGDQPSKGTGWLGAAFVFGAFPILMIDVGDGLQGVQISNGEARIAKWWTVVLEWKVLTLIIVLVGSFFLFRWIADACSAWLEFVLKSRSPQLILGLTVGVAYILLILALGSASVTVLVAFGYIAPTGTPNSTFAYDVVAGVPVLLASVLAWAFPMAALWRRETVTPGKLADWVFLDGSSPRLPREGTLRPSQALVVGVVIGLAFWLLWEMVYFRAFFSVGVSDKIVSAYSWLSGWTVRMFGNSNKLLANDLLLNSAITFQALAAATAAGRASRQSVVHGLFAASVAGGVISAGYWIFVSNGLEIRALVSIGAALVLTERGTIAALPAIIVVVFISSVVRRIFTTAKGPRLKEPLAVPANSLRSDSRSAGFAGSRRRSMVWGVTATLCAIVAIGMAARVREEVRTTHELRANRAAAEQGDSAAETKLGIAYTSGQGVLQDDTVAFRWFGKAAEQGDAEAQYNLGAFYALGRGTPRDDAAALEWIRRSAEHGFAAAQNNLGVIYHEGRLLPRNDALAIEWFRRAAEQGDPAAQFNVAEAYESGDVVAKDERQAIAWFRKAAEKGFSPASDRLQALCNSGLQSACSL
jgi:hypothetical protein